MLTHVHRTASSRAPLLRDRTSDLTCALRFAPTLSLRSSPITTLTSARIDHITPLACTVARSRPRRKWIGGLVRTSKSGVSACRTRQSPPRTSRFVDRCASAPLAETLDVASLGFISRAASAPSGETEGKTSRCSEALTQVIQAVCMIIVLTQLVRVECAHGRLEGITSRVGGGAWTRLREVRAAIHPCQRRHRILQ